jgi:hypothetical protein
VATRTADVWAYRDSAWISKELNGFEVEAADGAIGKIDESTRDTAAGHIVVDTGPWIFGRKVMLPAGVIRDVDFDSQKVFVDRTKAEIKHAPEFTEGGQEDAGYRTELGRYYGTPRDEIF